MNTPHPWRGLREWKRHSVVLMVAGLVYMVLGFSYMFVDLTPATRVGLHLALLWAPKWFWGSLFVLAGVLSIVSSRWPPVSETWGYIVLTGLSCGWAAIYASGMIFFHADLVNIRGVMSFGLLGFLWWGISGLINPGSEEALVAKNTALKREVSALHVELDAVHRQLQSYTRRGA